jgi:radical SAM enzyme (TIGR01210 family)
MQKAGGLRLYMKNYEINEPLSSEIKKLRIKSFRNKEYDLNRPVSFWIKADRLLHERGKELTIILRTRGCNWALGEYGGCSMCGYIQDTCNFEIDEEQIINQLNYVLENVKDEINDDVDQYAFKIYNSGSFFDPQAIPINVRNHIYKKIKEYSNIKEFVCESRIEFIDEPRLNELKKNLDDRYCEIGIGLETVNDHIRKNYINKGITLEQFTNTLALCKDYAVGVRAYLLFKPPFLNEQGAIDDCIQSIKQLIDLKVNSISINPMNIQKGTLVEALWNQKRYRAPWYYSIFECLRSALSSTEQSKRPRIIIDPSGTGSERGIHNCLRKECNGVMLDILRRFVLSQDIKILNEIDDLPSCQCEMDYILQKDLF